MHVYGDICIALIEVVRYSMGGSEWWIGVVCGVLHSWRQWHLYLSISAGGIDTGVHVGMHLCRRARGNMKNLFMSQAKSRRVESCRDFRY